MHILQVSSSRYIININSSSVSVIKYYPLSYQL